MAGAIGARAAAILTILNETKKPLSAFEMWDKIDQKLFDGKRDRYQSTIANLKTRKSIEVAGIVHGRTTYKIIARGVELLENGRIEPTKKRGSYKKKAKTKKTPAAVESPQIELNISASALSLTDQIGAVIQENVSYRDLMLSTAQNIAKPLGFKLVPITEED